MSNIALWALALAFVIGWGGMGLIPPRQKIEDFFNYSLDSD